jgi:hypothetical protein
MKIGAFNETAAENMKRIVARASLLFMMIYANACLAQSSPEINSTLKTGSASPHSSGYAASTSPQAADPAGEKWTELNAVRSGLDPSRIESAVLAKWDFPDYTSELVRVEWRANDPIELYVVRPHGVVKPPVILYLYNFPADTDHFRERAWCEFVSRNGFAAVGFVSALTGQRYHTRPMREWFVSELQEALGTSTHDVQMILDYLASRGDIDASKVGMLGEGSGGAIAILAAAADPRIGFVDAINPWGDWPDWLKQSSVVPDKERPAYLEPEFLQKVAMLDPLKYLPHFSPERIRIEEVTSDPMTPSGVQAKYTASAPSPGRVVRYPDVHAQIQAWTTQYWWLKEQLQPHPTPAIPKDR